MGIGDDPDAHRGTVPLFEPLFKCQGHPPQLSPWESFSSSRRPRICSPSGTGDAGTVQSSKLSERSGSDHKMATRLGSCGPRRFHLPLTLAILTVADGRIVPEILAVE